MFDVSTRVGLMVGLGAILGGNGFEGGHFGSLGQLAAPIILVGGTVGAGAVRSLESLTLGLRRGLVGNAGATPRQHTTHLTAVPGA